ncbi:glutamic acid-rich protein isoform X2 [Diachasma alloeum]|uniref:glutamic acid-rich protein isoform X2 n=1 Tax=Diachasma alloeum TaxID=454923 RepID=UPI0007382E0E|nr:glutamic acid-rich protein isoform X2 [Diachasma alloeum]
MSGDVQPRKRKEKRRKREDEDAGTPPPTLIGSSDHGENVTIHVHKEGGTGGHWCAKIIFFVLLSVLVGLVGVIIFESRGSTDVDTPVASSRWAMIFEGWVDDSLSLHDEHDESHDKGSHEALSHEADEEHEEEQDEHEETDEEAETAGSEEAAASEEHEDEGEGDDEEQEEEDGTGEEGDPADQEEDDETGPDGVSGENDDDVNDDEKDEPNDSGTLEEVDEEEVDNKNAEDDENENDDVEDSKEETDAELLDISIEGVSPSPLLNEEDEEGDNEDDLSYEFVGIPGVNDIDDDSDEPLEEIEDDPEIEEVTNNDPVDLESEKEDEIEEESSSVAVKFGVGVALVVAAHFVLVRRWSNVDVELAAYNGEGPPDLSRRDTLISPTPLIPKVLAKEPVQQGSKVDSSNLTSRPPKDPEPQISSIPKRMEIEIDTSESELHSGTEEDVNYEEDSEEEEEEEEEEEDDIVAMDDTELVAKLEAKYGKIPTPSQSENEDDEELDDEELDEEEEEEEEEDESEEDDEEEGESEKHYDWKHVNAPKAHSGPEPKEKATRSTGAKGDQGKSAPGGRQDFTSNNASDFDELLIQEELENWLMRDFDN